MKKYVQLRKLKFKLFFFNIVVTLTALANPAETFASNQSIFKIDPSLLAEAKFRQYINLCFLDNNQFNYQLKEYIRVC